MFSRSRLWDTVTMLYNSAIIDKASKQEIINVSVFARYTKRILLDNAYLSFRSYPMPFQIRTLQFL